MECESEKKSGNHMVSLFGNDTVVDHSQSIVSCARTWTYVDVDSRWIRRQQRQFQRSIDSPAIATIRDLWTMMFITYL